MLRRRALALMAFGVPAWLLSACGRAAGEQAGGASSETGAAGSGAGPVRVSGRITVLAATSLGEALGTLATGFQASHPGTRIEVSFDATSEQASKIMRGQQADVFASGSAWTMQQVVKARAAGVPQTFARNVLQIAVPPANPARIAKLADLARPGVRVAMCAPDVPAGALARQVIANAGLSVHPTTLEPDVKGVMAKVVGGQVDAGLVYVTDVRAAGSKVSGVLIPAAVNASTGYSIAVLTASTNRPLAQAFVDYVLSPKGRAVLMGDGFALP